MSTLTLELPSAVREAQRGDSVQPDPITVENYLRLPDWDQYELVDGILTEEPAVGAYADSVSLRTGTRFETFADRKGGLVFGSSTPYDCFGPGENARRPACSYVAPGRLPGEVAPEGAMNIPADVAVEVMSPSDVYRHVREKIELYLNHGFGQVWLLVPEQREMYIYQRGQPPRVLIATDTFTGTGVLEGLTFGVGSLFPKRAPVASDIK
jgi:Uma2 family endonuclease